MQGRLYIVIAALNISGLFRRSHLMLETPYHYAPADNLIIGARAIADYVKARRSFLHLVEEYSFPVAYRPSDGKMITTIRSIDQWIFAVAAAVGESGAMTRYHPARNSKHFYNERWATKKYGSWENYQAITNAKKEATLKAKKEASEG